MTTVGRGAYLRACISYQCSDQGFIQIGGAALRVQFSVPKRLFHADYSLRRIFLTYAQYQNLVVGQPCLQPGAIVHSGS